MTQAAQSNPRLFVGSSSEGLTIAYAIQENLDRDAEVTVWPQAVFELSAGTLESLLTHLDTTDFGVFVFTPDDVVRLRGTEYDAARDNVVFELGLFIGRLGRQRSFIVLPRGEGDLRIPSDLAGLSPATYEANRSDGNLQAALGAACNQIRRAVRQLGAISRSAKILTPANPHEAVLRGIRRAATQIARAIGPNGLPVSVELQGGTQVITKSGSLIARGVTGEGLEARGVQEIREVTQEMDDAMGDGAKVAALLAHSMIENGRRAIESGLLPQGVVDGMHQALELAKSALRTQRKQSGRDDVWNVAATAAGSKEIATLVVDAMAYGGPDGVITVYESQVDRARLERLEGARWEYGYSHPSFVEESDDGKVDLTDCYILVTTERVSGARQLLPLLEQVVPTGRPLLIVAQDVEGEAFATLLLNRRRGVVNAVAIKTGTVTSQRRSALEDLAVLTGATLIARDAGLILESTTLDHLGQTKRAIVEQNSMTVIEGAGDPQKVDFRVSSLRAAMSRAEGDNDREDLVQRIARMKGGVANIVVGGLTFSDTFEAKYQVWSAIHSARKAVEGGVLVGGGKALLNAVDSLASVSADSAAEVAGVAAIRVALEEPTRRLIATAKQDEQSTMATIVSPMAPRFGFNARTGSSGDLVSAGILDPEPVLTHALSVAFSHARRVLLTDTWDLTNDRT